MRAGLVAQVCGPIFTCGFVYMARFPDGGDEEQDGVEDAVMETHGVRSIKVERGLMLSISTNGVQKSIEFMVCAI